MPTASRTAHRLPRWLGGAALSLSLSLATGAAFAQPKKEVTIAHQDMLVPFRLVMESGELEKATGYKINWRMFGGGGDVIKAMASGDVQIGEAGSSPITAAASQGQDVKLIWILDDIADAERVTGWTLKPEGLCRDDLCVPLPAQAVQGREVDVEAFWKILGGPVIASDGGVTPTRRR